MAEEVLDQLEIASLVIDEAGCTTPESMKPGFKLMALNSQPIKDRIKDFLPDYVGMYCQSVVSFAAAPAEIPGRQ